MYNNERKKTKKTQKLTHAQVPLPVFFLMGELQQAVAVFAEFLCLFIIYLSLFCLVGQALILAKCFTVRQESHTCLIASTAIANITSLNLSLPVNFPVNIIRFM